MPLHLLGLDLEAARCSELLSADMRDISLAESACKLGLGKTDKVAKFCRDASLLKGCLK